jgi:5'-3' exonuclease
VRVHLVDGTYELFRSHFGAPPATAPDGTQVGAVRGLLRSMQALVTTEGATHVACAFDHVIESFRNDLYAGYKTSEGVPPELLAQFPLAERAVAALGLVVWSMVEFEADDALAAGAARYAPAAGVDQVVICTPDKDLAQCVVGESVVCLDRRRRIVLDDAGVRQKFGVPPGSIPDFLALVGDTADGYPGVARWGEKSAGAVLARYGHLEAIPDYAASWDVPVRGALALADGLRAAREEALLFRRLATLRRDVLLKEELDDLRYRGAHREALLAVCAEIGENDLPQRITIWRETEPVPFVAPTLTA